MDRRAGSGDLDSEFEIVLGEKVLHENVAIASMRELDGKDLLALNLKRKSVRNSLNKLFGSF